MAGGVDLPGPSSERAEAASRRVWLEARVFGVAAPDPRDVVELRELLAAGLKEQGGTASAATSAAETVSVAALEFGHPDRARPSRPPLAWLAGALTAVVLAGVVGAGATVALLRPSSAPAAATIASSGSGGVASALAVHPGAAADAASTAGSTSASARAAAIALAEQLGREYFARSQAKADLPTVALPRIVPSSTRRVLVQWGDVNGEAKVWVARGVDRSFCLVMSVDSTRAASACTPAADAASTGVRLSIADGAGGSIEARWILSAGLLQLSPYPSGTSVVSSVPSQPNTSP